MLAPGAAMDDLVRTASQRERTVAAAAQHAQAEEQEHQENIERELQQIRREIDATKHSVDGLSGQRNSKKKRKKKKKKKKTSGQDQPSAAGPDGVDSALERTLSQIDALSRELSVPSSTAAVAGVAGEAAGGAAVMMSLSRPGPRSRV